VYIYQNENEAEGRVLGFDTASYPRRILPLVMMQHRIPEERPSQPHSCGNFVSPK